MSIYPDTTFYVALRFFNDTHHEAATDYFAQLAEDVFLWSPWHRVEVPNALRQFTRTEPAALREADARRIIHRLELDVRQGYFLHIEKDWRDVLRAACDISARHAFTFPCRAADLLHVAYAKELRADLFISFDDDQVKLAKAAGMKTLRPG
ncbi:MAG TPA: type II toxin-antitoxin system VapC family toxin [Verrucomicrobiae bacterium]|nr:type II toxin-antitoxin system VapC family toxin [Verrucomicrobiae bacterium]